VSGTINAAALIYSSLEAIAASTLLSDFELDHQRMVMAQNYKMVKKVKTARVSETEIKQGIIVVLRQTDFRSKSKMKGIILFWICDEYCGFESTSCLLCEW
jgi:hypothetical protein